MTDPGRTAFLKRVRSALGDPARDAASVRTAFADPDPEMTAALRKTVRDRSPEERGVLLDRLAEAAGPLNIQLLRADDETAAAAAIVGIIQSRPPEWGGEKRVAAWDHPLIASLDLEGALRELDVPVFITRSTETDREAVRKAVGKAYIGITSAEWCVASTATLACRNHPGMPRSVSLVPSIHVAVISTGRVAADFHELYALLNAELDEKGRGLTDAMTFITGPSKTADIEATLVHGAHGPRELHLIVIGG